MSDSRKSDAITVGGDLMGMQILKGIGTQGPWYRRVDDHVVTITRAMVEQIAIEIRRSEERGATARRLSQVMTPEAGELAIRGGSDPRVDRALRLLKAWGVAKAVISSSGKGYVWIWLGRY